MTPREKHASSLALCFLLLNVFLLFHAVRPEKSGFYFLNVGQGDSELIRLPGGIDILVDGGRADERAVREIERILPFFDRYIDLVVMTHAEADHFGGLTDVLARYKVGAFLWNGVRGTAASLADLEEKLAEHQVRVAELAAGDRIRYGETVFYVIWPDASRAERLTGNDASLVMLAHVGGVKAFFTGDIGSAVEYKVYETLYRVDVLKVAHHGSKDSSSLEFLEKIRPNIAVIEVGENSYGHPAPETLKRLADAGARIYRTDRDGTVVIPLE
ncbi:hypothetical protein A2110_00195 [Candidatus Jorgensenbacteria bacterium GWA1_54_12]|uniref:Metallo-beta-lactamase domain-containing protein n=1 Tax=Candidatus Jorgensenbacteria bacterium GWA1_54_12 TaxID=1798468 RepID=A0A1F6BKY4_9BACT|nr:MAG: hypothetical protein A2110_00195 [Candidatus Jorgensenbacteria bacterium GWA1_54_12]